MVGRCPDLAYHRQGIGAGCRAVDGGRWLGVLGQQLTLDACPAESLVRMCGQEHVDVRVRLRELDRGVELGPADGQLRSQAAQESSCVALVDGRLQDRAAEVVHRADLEISGLDPPLYQQRFAFVEKTFIVGHRG